MRPAGVDYNLTLCRQQYIYHGQPYARVDLNPMPESTLSPSQEIRIWPHVTSTSLRGGLDFRLVEPLKARLNTLFSRCTYTVFAKGKYTEIQYTSPPPQDPDAGTQV
jgi:hypothetical protein